MHWDTAKIAMIIARAIPGSNISVEPPGGDYDTEYVCVKLEVEKGSIMVFGMNPITMQAVTSPSNCQVDMIFTCNNDRHGMVYANYADFDLLAKIQAALTSAGYNKFETSGWKSFF